MKNLRLKCQSYTLALNQGENNKELNNNKKFAIHGSTTE